ncbi:MAG: DUF349 domain-containing protein [Proteobacteria bacterium]|nr:DUF349 domain-containing protein [Pseudomonadota bacterium]
MFAMFDLFRKRGTQPIPDPEKPESTPEAEPFKMSRQGAMVQAEELMHDEVAATEFILCCAYADARLKAATHIHARPQVERVLQAVRNSDRRVAKLMLSRLDLCREWEADEHSARQRIGEACGLVDTPHLLPSQVAALDKAWAQIKHAPPPLQENFDVVREQLRQRLEAQAILQRAVMDVLAQLHALVPSCDVEPTIAALEQQMAHHASASEAPALPRNLMIEFEESAANLRRAVQMQARYRQACELREQALTNWEAEQSVFKPDHLTRVWQALPAVDDADLFAPLQERFEALRRRNEEQHQAQAALAEKMRGDVREEYAKTLNAMEHALQEGALQEAAGHERHLRALDTQGLRGSAQQSERLQQARAELHRLQDWARWGGRVSREELLHAAHTLQTQTLPPAELARKVASLRERWKSLDVSAGPAQRDLWQQFDAACTAAYAPAAAHFKHLAEQRDQHAAQARELIDEARKFAANTAVDDDAVDWKSVAHSIERLRQRWQSVGALARQERKKLESDFAAALHDLSGRLMRQREQATQRRIDLIAEVEKLHPQERGALDHLHALQERWQQHAKALPLARRQEQELWQRFRQACDAVFAHRKQATAAADADRRQHLADKEVLCARLEAAQIDSPAMLSDLLRETQAAWGKIGSVPRASEQPLEARYRKAVRALQQQRDAEKKKTERNGIDALHRKLCLCQWREEQADKSDEAIVQSQCAEWDALPIAPDGMEAILHARFEAGVHQRADVLEANRPNLQRELLRLEILLGLDSPPELARERLQLQVEGLQSAFKSGRSVARHGLDVLGELCRLPAAATPADTERIARIMRAFQH